MVTYPNAALKRLFGIDLPIIQAPMAGVSTPAMAAAVSNQGGLGSLGVGAMSASQAREAIREFRALSDGPLNVNVFVHQPAQMDPLRDRQWLQRLQPEFERVGATPPQQLREIYQSFTVDDEMLTLLTAETPEVVSFHFGVPRPEQVDALRRAGITLIATATNIEEARTIAAAGIDGIVAQGYEAGGHRGVFDPHSADSCLGTFALTRVLRQQLSLPVIAAGGIMDGAGIAAALALGAIAAQLGTAFVGTHESLADAGYRERLFSAAAHHTTMTRVISGRPARVLSNDFASWGATVPDNSVPDYPLAYDAGKALHNAAKAAGQNGYGAHWAGQGAALARALSTAELMQELTKELQQALS